MTPTPFDELAPRSMEQERIAREDAAPWDSLTPGQQKARKAREYKRQERQRERDAKAKVTRAAVEKKEAEARALEGELYVTRLAMELQTYNFDGTEVLDAEDLEILADVAREVEVVAQRGLSGNQYAPKKGDIALWMKLGALPETLVNDFRRFVRAALGENFYAASK